MSKPLLESHVLPPFARIQPEQVGEAIDQILADNRARIAQLTQNTELSWASLPAVMEELEDRLNQAWAPVSHLNAVMNSPAWREAYNAQLPKLSAYYTELGQNEALFLAYEKLAQSPEAAGFNPAQRKTLDNALRDFKLSGVALPAAQKQRYAEIMEKLSALTAQFSDHVLDATQAWELLLADDSRLQGLPDSALGLLRELAAAKEKEGYRITLDAPSYMAVITYADDRALREAIYTAYVTRASEQGPQAGQFDNSAIIEEILALRLEEAQVLGYANFAQVSLVPKMAHSVEEVVAFLDDLALKARPGAERDLAELRAFAAKLGISDLQPWDTAYASEKLKQEKYAISQEALRPYFPAPRVIAGMLRTAEKLYGLEIREVQGVEVWHPDATFYEIFENGEKIAAFYLDPYARANKRGGAWMADCRVRRRLADGTLQKPVAFLTCNFNPPVEGKPALLTHDEVTTLFHEFGHGLHHMLTRIEVAAVSGINGVAWDAVELPSQFFENWCYEPEALALISGHVESGEPLPAALLDKMLAAKNFQSGLQMLRQIEFALFDMKIHAAERALNISDVQKVLDEVRAQVTLLKPPAFNRFQHGFSHIFAGGYAAGYYSYKWAEVLSADAFSRFEEEGVFNPETGRSFRENILAQGGSAEPAELFRAFRGREPSVDALLRHSGL